MARELTPISVYWIICRKRACAIRYLRIFPASGISFTTSFVKRPQMYVCCLLQIDINAFIYYLFSFQFDADKAHMGAESGLPSGDEYCSICSGTCRNGGSLSFTGFRYHHSCANFWLNFVDASLPHLQYEDFWNAPFVLSSLTHRKFLQMDVYYQRSCIYLPFY